MGTPTEPPPATSPLFVFGADHSGTTILYRMVAYHPRLVWFSQFSLRGGQIPGRSRRPGAHRLEPLAHSTIRRFLSHPWGKPELGRLRRLVVPRPGEEGKIWDHLLEGDAASSERLREWMLAWSERFGGRRVLAKRPGFYRHLDLLQAAFPDASFVHLVRDGRPVALSMREKALATGYVHARTVPLGDLGPQGALRAGARHWVEVLDQVATAGPINLLEVTYEDLCRNVHGVIGSVLRHARLGDEAFPYSRCPEVLQDQSARRLDAATGAELAEISEIQRPFLLRYGYPTELAGASGGTAAGVSIAARE